MKISSEELLLEEEKLATTIKEINYQIESAGADILESGEELKEFQKLVWDNKHEYDPQEMMAFLSDNDMKVNILEDKAKRVRRLQKIKNSPYFGSIRFNGEDIYIGITAVKKDLDYYIYDWRSPICSMFYDYEIGPACYEAPGGNETGEINRKRQYKIEEAKLKHVFDTNINIDDDVLQEVLAESNTDKMKNIVNTIQAEQNAVIRDFTTKNIIVQGIAGSGKTSVALHRIAFLLYKLDHISSGNVLIFSPNNIFTEYISDVLPDLGEDNTLQTTFHEFASAYITEYYRVEPYSHFVERYYKMVRQDNDLIRFKLSDEFAIALEEFVHYYEKAARFLSDLVYKNQKISMDEINTLLFERFADKPLFERVDLIAEKINNRYFKGLKKDFNSIRSQLYKIANFKKDYRLIYKSFFSSAIFLAHYPYMYRKNENIKNLEQKVINYEDSTPFIYLKCLLEGFPYNVAMRQVVIDEAQDYTYLQYKIIHKIFKNADFTILGDVNQTVNPYYKYDNLNILLNIFSEDSKYLELNKTYRSSPEIIAYANSILNLSHVSAIRRNIFLPVIKKPMSDIKHIAKSIRYLKKKYQSVAIITKSIEEAKLLKDSLITRFEEITLIDIDTINFKRDLVVAPAYGVKGLEFDAVIIINNFIEDKYLYYVAVTRSQHELIVYE